jgi:hypothetical protein
MMGGVRAAPRLRVAGCWLSESRHIVSDRKGLLHGCHFECHKPSESARNSPYQHVATGKLCPPTSAKSRGTLGENLLNPAARHASVVLASSPGTPALTPEYPRETRGFLFLRTPFTTRSAESVSRQRPPLARLNAGCCGRLRDGASHLSVMATEDAQIMTGQRVADCCRSPRARLKSRGRRLVMLMAPLTAPPYRSSLMPSWQRPVEASRSSSPASSRDASRRKAVLRFMSVGAATSLGKGAHPVSIRGHPAR